MRANLRTRTLRVENGPNPVALRNRFAVSAAVVLPIPADRVKDKFCVSRTTIMERLATDDLVGIGGEELRDESAEGFRIFAMRQMETFEGAGDERLIDERLIPGCCLRILEIISSNNISGRKSIGIVI